MTWIHDPQALLEAVRRVGLVIKRQAGIPRNCSFWLEEGAEKAYVAVIDVSDERITLGFDLPHFGRVVIHFDLLGGKSVQLQIDAEKQVRIIRSNANPGGDIIRTAPDLPRFGCQNALRRIPDFTPDNSAT